MRRNTRPGELVITGYCPAVVLKDGPLTLEIRVDGQPLATTHIVEKDAEFRRMWPLPPAAAKPDAMHVELHLGRTITLPHDRRRLGLVISTIEVR